MFCSSGFSSALPSHNIHVQTRVERERIRGFAIRIVINDPPPPTPVN